MTTTPEVAADAFVVPTPTDPALNVDDYKDFYFEDAAMQSLVEAIESSPPSEIAKADVTVLAEWMLFLRDQEAYFTARQKALNKLVKVLRDRVEAAASVMITDRTPQLTATIVAPGSNKQCKVTIESGQETFFNVAKGSWDQFLNWAIENDQLHCIKKAVSSKAIEEVYAEIEQLIEQGVLTREEGVIPGINRSSHKVLVTRFTSSKAPSTKLDGSPTRKGPQTSGAQARSAPQTSGAQARSAPLEDAPLEDAPLEDSPEADNGEVYETR